MSDLKMFVVVCTELHYVRGPYVTLEQATEVAKTLTSQSSCLYKPVPFVFEGEVEVHAKDDTPEEDAVRRGYL